MQLATYFSENRGAQADLARLLCVPQSLPSAWAAIDPKKRRPVPVRYCVAIERATGGAVSRRELRPGDWRDIWPELECAAPIAIAAPAQHAQAAVNAECAEVGNA
ncbi:MULTISPECIES: YdaS family helix-turn-helix protein [unclassified Acidovorax]|uniref:transcriptional regulator n=1 Tax=unclassified Acidovorax TaxID=2684926 RepID=UPI001C4668D7|nr:MULTISPECIES: YdaS family helix-turn-helix protein [unclassified Acidovorax]MBV7459468.1 helix-turn-helix domain-containing protein [Acidovorax sp. sif0632]MBV7464493.1 helix-turn-helix domain-containing protein [Acidovorax sp. sif0613]